MKRWLKRPKGNSEDSYFDFVLSVRLKIKPNNSENLLLFKERK